jgi:predicted transposase YdaD
MLSERFDEWEAQFRREGRQEGREEGIQEGRQDGEATLLTRQLLKRFGELPDSVRSRLRAAPLDELEHWGERLLDVSSLDELFTDARSSLP